MNTQLSTEELNFLARKGLFSEIAGNVQSPRARRPGATVSAYYVRKVLKGEVNTNTDTAKEVINLAKLIVNNLFINNEAKNI